MFPECLLDVSWIFTNEMSTLNSLKYQIFRVQTYRDGGLPPLPVKERFIQINNTVNGRKWIKILIFAPDLPSLNRRPCRVRHFRPHTGNAGCWVGIGLFILIFNVLLIYCLINIVLTALFKCKKENMDFTLQ